MSLLLWLILYTHYPCNTRLLPQFLYSLSLFNHLLSHKDDEPPSHEHPESAFISAAANDHLGALTSLQDGIVQASPPVLSDEEGVIAFLRDDVMGGAEEATSAAHAFLQAVITFRNCCVEHLGG